MPQTFGDRPKFREVVCQCDCKCRRRFVPEKWYHKVCWHCIRLLMEQTYKGHIWRFR